MIIEETVTTCALDSVSTLGCALAILIAGRWLKGKFKFLKKYLIPSPVVGGIVFALIMLICHEYRMVSLTFDQSLKDLTMLMFFTGVGYLASFRLIAKGGKVVVIFFLCTIFLILLQNLTGIGIAALFNKNLLLGLSAGSISLVGGHGTSAAFGPEMEKLGLTGGLSIAITCATFGLIAGSLIGGPLGKLLISKYRLEPEIDKDHSEEKKQAAADVSKKKVGEMEISSGLGYLIVAMTVGSWCMSYLKTRGIVLPGYLGPMVIACIIRNVSDLMGRKVPMHAVELCSNTALRFFLAFALMNLHLWELKSLALPIICILLLQCVMMAMFAYFVTFRVMGSNYDAAVMCSGQCGFAMGATPNALANMDTVTKCYGPSPKSFFVISIVGALLIDFVNALLITAFCRFLV